MGTLKESDLNQFTGDPDRYHHQPFRRMCYTLGIHHIAREGKAYWLIDAISSHIGSPEFNDAVAKDERIGERHFWTFERGGGTAAKLFAKADSPEDPFIVQNIGFTDFPLETIDIWAAWDGHHWTLYLPSEH